MSDSEYIPSAEEAAEFNPEAMRNRASRLGLFGHGNGSNPIMKAESPEEEADLRRMRMEARRAERSRRIEAGVAGDVEKAQREVGMAPAPAAPAGPIGARGFTREAQLDRARREYKLDLTGGEEVPMETNTANTAMLAKWEAEERAKRSKTGGRTVETGTKKERLPGAKEEFGTTLKAQGESIDVGDEAIGHSAMIGGTMDLTPGVSNPWAKHAPQTPGEQAAKNMGQMLLRVSGRCNHVNCQLKRMAGLSMLGQPVASRDFGMGVESHEAAIPSIPVVQKEYRTNPATGKEDRKAPPVIIHSQKPADPKSPEWLSAKAEANQGQGSRNLFMAEDLLEHHHPEDEPLDVNFVKSVWSPQEIHDMGLGHIL